MIFLKNIKTLIIISFFLVGTFSYASDKQETSDCGVSYGVVKLFNGEICEQDGSFRILYRLFPTVIENFVFPLVNSKYLSLVPKIEEKNLHIYKTQEILFFEIFKTTNKIMFFIISIYIFWHFIILGLIRSANDGSFLGKSWDTSAVLKRYGILIVLLFPVSSTGVLVIHVVILAMTVLSIYFANFMWGVYLNYLQVGEEGIDISNAKDSVVDQLISQEDKFNSTVSKYDHNYFFAYSYAKTLSKIALCKSRSEKLFVLSALPNTTGSNVEDIKKCFIDRIDNASWISDSINNSGTTSFIHYSNEKSQYDFTKKGNNFYMTSNIVFGNKDFKQCQSSSNNDFRAFDYKCGSIKVSNPVIPVGNINIAISESNFYSQYKSASIDVIKNKNPSVEKYWKSLSLSLDVLFGDGGALSNFKHNKGMIKKNVSFYFHRMLMNDALVGNSNYTSKRSSNSEISNNESFNGVNFVKKESNFNLLLSSYMRDAKKVSDSIENIACLKNPVLYKSASRAKKLISSYETNEDLGPTSGFNTTCLDVTTMKVLGIDSLKLLDDDETGALLKSETTKQIWDSTSAGIKAMADLTERIRSKREAVERSFYISLIDSPSNDMVNRLRKEGWWVSGGYMLKLLNEKEMDNKLRRVLQNSSVAKSDILNNQYLPQLDLNKIMGVDDTTQLPKWFDLSSESKSILEGELLKPARKDLKYVDVSQFLKDNIFDSMGSADFDASGRDSITGLLINANLIKNIKAVVGINSTGELSIAQIASCISTKEGAIEKCPMNVVSPIIATTKLGHNLIDLSSRIIIAALGVATFEIALTSGLKIRALKENKGIAKGSNAAAIRKNSSMDYSVSKKRSEMKNSQMNKDSSLKSNIFKSFEGISDFLHYFLKIMLGFSVLLLTVGFTLAYVIPLIPFIAFTVAFISWIILTIQILIIAPIWLGFLFRIEDSNKTSTELYMAGFNFIMQILFRPALIVVAIVVGWSMFSVVFMIINMTMATFMEEFNDSGFLISFVYGLLLVISYTLVLYVSIKMIFNLMIMLPNRIFIKAHVQPLDSSFESRSKDTLSTVTMSSIGGTGLMAKYVSKSMEDNMKERSEFKEVQKQKIQDFKEGLSKKMAEEKKNLKNKKDGFKND